MKLQFLLGLGGVSGLESKKARRVGKFFEYAMAVIAVVLLAQWHFELRGVLGSFGDHLINWFIWLFFVVEVLILVSLVEDRFRYLRQNWFCLFVIIMGVPLLFGATHIMTIYRLLKPILALILLVPWLGLFKYSLTDNRLSTTLATIFFTVIMAGVLMTGIDPGIKTISQGIWWAWVTMSTVGYGDYVPVTLPGRIFGSVVILMGLCFFAVLTANFSSIFVRRDVSRFRSKESKDIERVIEHINEIEGRDQKLVEMLEKIESRLDSLEKKEGE